MFFFSEGEYPGISIICMRSNNDGRISSILLAVAMKIAFERSMGISRYKSMKLVRSLSSMSNSIPSILLASEIFPNLSISSRCITGEKVPNRSTFRIIMPGCALL